MKDPSPCPHSRCHHEGQGEVENSSQLLSAGREPSLDGHPGHCHRDPGEVHHGGRSSCALAPLGVYVTHKMLVPSRGCHRVSPWGLEAMRSTVLSLYVFCASRCQLINKRRATGRVSLPQALVRIPGSSVSTETTAETQNSAKDMGDRSPGPEGTKPGHCRGGRAVCLLQTSR